MAVIIEVQDPEGDVVTQVLPPTLDVAIDVVDNPNVITVTDTVTAATTVEVLAGIQGPPGVQNVFVQTTAPSNPQEGYVWIDIS